MISRRMLSAVAGAVVALAAIVLVFSAITTSSARVAATTASSGFFVSGEVLLSQPGEPVDVLFSGDGLYPGVETTGCVVVEYDGTVPVEIRVHGRVEGGNGLHSFVELVLAVDEQGLCPDDVRADDVRTPVEVYRDRLSGLWELHGRYDSGIVVADEVMRGDRVALRGTATLLDDNRAQGLTTEFVIVIEARP